MRGVLTSVRYCMYIYCVLCIYKYTQTVYIYIYIFIFIDFIYKHNICFLNIYIHVFLLINIRNKYTQYTHIHSIQDYLYSAFYDKIVTKQLHRKLSF